MEKKIFILLLAVKTIMSSSLDGDYRLFLDDFKLPNIYDQIDYKITLHLFPELFTPKVTHFSGEILIGFESRNVTDYISLHSSYKMINLKKITFENVEIPTSNYTVNNVTDILTIHLANVINTNIRYSLAIEYIGIVTTNGLVGMYKSSYVHNEETKYLLTTQMAPTHARKVFPCFDEPDYKAHFNVVVTFPSNLNVLFNTLEMRRTHDLKKGLTRVHFHQTPKMSPHILALVVSDLTCTVADFELIPLRICSREEFASKRELALDITPKLLARINNFTNYNYERHSIGKLDLIAVPDFPPFTMENWGLIIHRESDLLYDKIESSNQAKEKIMEAIAHALTHQWFGNLVTFHWWSETYMNEGLATYFQYYFLNEVFPDYEFEKRFTAHLLHDALFQDARGLELFSLGLSYIETTAEIDFAFSEISFQKGCSIMRMVLHFMSMENFRAGIVSYFNKYEYDNVDIEDFWNELDGHIEDSISNMPANLSTVMENWIWREGYPLVTVRVEGNNLKISQSEFWYAGAKNGTKFYIPVSYTDSAHKSKFQSTIPDFWLTPYSDHEVDMPPESDWIILNNQQTGYYRVNYDTLLWDKIKAALQKDNFDGIIDINRAQIVDDLFNIARANLLSYSFVLDTIRFLKNDVSYYPWKAAVDDFETLLRRVGENTDLGKLIKSDILDLIHNFYNSVPFSTIKEDDHFYTLKQVLAVSWACRLGHEGCVKEAIELFKMYTSSGNRPSRELRSVIYCNGLRYSEDDNDWYYMWEAYLRAESLPWEKEIILKALGCSRKKTLLKSYLLKLITKDSGIRSQDAIIVFNAIRYNPEGIGVCLDFIIENQESIVEHYQDTDLLEVILVGTALRLSTEDQIKRLKELIDGGNLKEGFLKYGEKAKRIANIGASWRKIYSEELMAYYSNNLDNTVHGFNYLYLLLLLIPIIMLLGYKYYLNRRGQSLLSWFRRIITTNVWNRLRYQRQPTEDVPMVDQ